MIIDAQPRVAARLVSREGKLAALIAGKRRQQPLALRGRYRAAEQDLGYPCRLDQHGGDIGNAVAEARG